MDAKDHAVIAVLGDQRPFVVRALSWGQGHLAAFWTT
jgi:hypothetical protein